MGPVPQDPERHVITPSTLFWENCSVGKTGATVNFLSPQRYRPTGSTFIQVKLSGYFDSTTGLPSIRTSLRLGRR